MNSTEANPEGSNLQLYLHYSIKCESISVFNSFQWWHMASWSLVQKCLSCSAHPLLLVGAVEREGFSHRDPPPVLQLLFRQTDPTAALPDTKKHMHHRTNGYGKISDFDHVFVSSKSV